MKQHQLERSLARATGESVATIRRIGFSLFDPGDEPLDHDENLGPTVIDWDTVEAERIAMNNQFFLPIVRARSSRSTALLLIGSRPSWR